MIDQLMNILVQSSWQILILGLIVWPLSRLSLRAYPNFAYVLWAVILVKALIPFNISLPTQQLPVVSVSPVITGQFILTATAESASPFSLNTLLAMVWIFGVMFFAAKLVLGEYAHRKRMRSAEKISVEAWFSDMKAELGIKQKVHIYINENIQSPLMQGLWKVRIYLPLEYTSWTRDAQQSVLAHELIHVKRRDIVIIYLQAMVRTLYFFHPVIWLANDQVDLEREKICDDEAIDLCTADRGAYGQQLYKHLESQNGRRSTPVLAGGFFMTDSSILKRFRYIKEKRGDMQNKLKLYHVFVILTVISLAVMIACSTESDTSGVETVTLGKLASDQSKANSDAKSQLQINGLIWDKEKAYAIINNDIYGEGDVVEGYSIVQIFDTLILLEKGGEIVNLELQPKKEPAVPRPEQPPFPNENVVFQEYDDPPTPAGGYAAIQKAVKYPEQAKKAGVGGSVIIQATINTDGSAKVTEVLKGVDELLDQAAREAVERVEWIPAKQAGKAVAVRIALPVVFTMMTGDKEHSVTSAKAVGNKNWDKHSRPVDWKAISNNIIYPETARADGVTGTLTMQFTIETNGDLVNPRVITGPTHAALKEAAVYALKSTKWIPAEKDGLPVSSIMEMGIGFGSEEERKTQKIANGVRPID